MLKDPVHGFQSTERNVELVKNGVKDARAVIVANEDHKNTSRSNCRSTTRLVPFFHDVRGSRLPTSLPSSTTAIGKPRLRTRVHVQRRLGPHRSKSVRRPLKHRRPLESVRPSATVSIASGAPLRRGRTLQPDLQLSGPCCKRIGCGDRRRFNHHFLHLNDSVGDVLDSSAT